MADAPTPGLGPAGATRRDGGYATFHHTPTAAEAAGPDQRTEVMTTTDTGPDRAATDAPRRRGPDPLALVVGLATLAMAVFAFTGELPDLAFVDPRWLLAGGAAVVGLLLLVGNLRRSGGRRGGS